MIEVHYLQRIVHNIPFNLRDQVLSFLAMLKQQGLKIMVAYVA
jgi:hypothetical protein